MRHLCGVLCATAIIAAAGTLCAAEKHSFPAIAANQVWIESVPSGLPVYVADGGVSSAKAAFTPGNKKGNTPLLVPLEPGRYALGFTVPKGTGSPDAEFLPRSDAGLGAAGGGLDDKNDYVLSWISKTAEPTSFIALVFDSTASLDTVSAMYPPGHNFAFDEEKARAIILERGAKAGDVERYLELLRRGGKVLLSYHSTRKASTTIEVKVDKTLEVVPMKLR